MEFTLLQYITIFIICAIAKGYGTITGGGSALLQPFLITLGIPAPIAVSHDVAATIASYIASSTTFHKKSLIRYRIALSAAPGVLIGSIVGVYILTGVSEQFVEDFIAVFALFLLVFSFGFNKNIGVTEFPLPTHHAVTLPLFGFVLGTYMTFSGMGAGTFSTIALTVLFGTTLLQAIAVRTIIHGISTVLGLISYAFLGLLQLDLFLVMALGCGLGGYIGARFSVALRIEFLRYIFATAVIFFSSYLLLK